MRVTSGDAAKLAMLAGVTEMARVVAATYGPRGRTVMLDRPGGILATKDGVSVAWEVEPESRLRRLGTRALQEACARVNGSCGDGTTTTAILGAAVLREAIRCVAAGEHPAVLARDLQLLAARLDFDCCDPEPVEDTVLMREVALVASNGDGEVADALVDAMERVGSEGMVVVEAGKGRGIELDHKTGMEIDRGWESSEAAGPDGTSRHLDAPLVALVDAELTTMAQAAPILEQATQFPHPLVVVSRGCFGDALKLMVTNDRKLERADGGLFEVVAVRCPGHVDDMRTRLDDLAALTGATVVDPAVTPLEKFDSGMLGAAQTATVTHESATFVAFEDKFPLIEARVEQLRLEESAVSSSHDAEEIRTRIARLTDGFCVMRVGGASEAEIRERRARIEDALGALRVAVDGGVVPGAGVAYLALACSLEDPANSAGSRAAVRVLSQALREPLRTLARNAGAEPEVVLRGLLEASQDPGEGRPRPSWHAGWDAASGRVRDLRESPVLCDPLEVVRAVVLTAVSTASTLLTADVALTRVDS